MTGPRVSVLVVTRDRRPDVLETLAAVAAFEHPASRLEVLVLDNGSTDGTEAAVRAWIEGEGRGLARAECVRSEENLGASRARNLLAGRASPDASVFCVLDDDALPGPEFLPTMLGALEGDARAGMVGARIVAWEDPGRDLGGAGFVDWRLGRLREAVATGPIACDWVITCAALIRAEAFHAAGGFDEDYFVYHEDVDFGVRLGRRGWRVLYEPRAVARHKVPRGKTRAPERLYYVLRNKFLFLRKHLPPSRNPLPWILYGVGLVPWALAGSLAAHRGVNGPEVRAILAAGRDGLRGRTGRWVP